MRMRERHLAGFVFCMVLVMLAPMVCFATNYYVSVNGSNSYNGLAPVFDGTNGPWATIDKGDSTGVLRPGDTVNVGAGIYNIPVPSSTGGTGIYVYRCSGTAAAPITYLANGDVTVRMAIPTWRHDYFWQITSSYIIIDGFKLQCQNIWGTLMISGNAATGCEVKNCQITSVDPTLQLSPYAGIYLKGYNFKVHHNLITNAGVGVNCLYATGLIANNTIVNTGQAIRIAGNRAPNVKNNIIVNAGIGLYPDVSETALDYSYNTYFNCPIVEQFGSTQYTAPIGIAENITDPMFVGSGDYHLQSGSPMIDSGLGVDLPFSGEAPDRGCFETVPQLPCMIEGYVRTEAGNVAAGVDGVVVTMWKDGVQQARIITSHRPGCVFIPGFFSIDLADGVYTVRADHPRYNSAVVDAVEVVQGQKSIVELIVTLSGPKQFFVDNASGDDSNPGTADLPWKTITNGDANSYLIPGDTVVVKAGTYDIADPTPGVACTFMNIVNCIGNSTNPITYLADGEVILKMNSTAFEADMGLGINAHYNVIDGFKIRCKNIWGAIAVNATGCEVRNCEIVDDTSNALSPYCGIFAAGGAFDAKIHHNLIIAEHALHSQWCNGYMLNNTIVGKANAIIIEGQRVPTIKNNILANAAIGLQTLSGSVDQAGLSFGYNDYCNCAVAQKFINTNYVTPIGAHETAFDPMFVGNGDYHLASGSPAIEAGVYVGLPFNGSAPNLGAYEGSVTVAPTEVKRLADLKSLSDGTMVKLTQEAAATVSSNIFSDGSYYIEELDRSMGIKVSGGPAVNVGERVTLTGVLTTDTNGQRMINISSIDSKTTAQPPLGALGMTNKACKNEMVTGLLTTIWGKVIFAAADSSYFIIADGSGTGLRVMATALNTPLSSIPSVNSYVSVTGLIGIAKDGTTAITVVRPRQSTDIKSYE